MKPIPIFEESKHHIHSKMDKFLQGTTPARQYTIPLYENINEVNVTKLKELLRILGLKLDDGEITESNHKKTANVMWTSSDEKIEISVFNDGKSCRINNTKASEAYNGVDLPIPDDQIAAYKKYLKSGKPIK